MPMPAPAVMAAAKTAPAWGAAALGGLKAFGGWLGKNQGLASLGSNLLGGLFGGGDSYASGAYKRGVREEKKKAEWYRDNITGISALVKDAKKAGVHPNAILGGGSNAGQVIASQPAGGGKAKEAMHTIADYTAGRQAQQDRIDLVQAQAQASAMRIAEHLIQNDVEVKKKTSTKSVNPHEGFDRYNLDSDQELKKGEVQARSAKNSEQTKNEKSVYTLFHYGGQKVWLPTEEIAEFFESWGSMLPMAATYHGNKNVDFQKLWYYHKNGTMEGYKPMVKITRQLDYYRRKAIKNTAKGLRKRRNVQKQKRSAKEHQYTGP